MRVGSREELEQGDYRRDAAAEAPQHQPSDEALQLLLRPTAREREGDDRRTRDDEVRSGDDLGRRLVRRDGPGVRPETFGPLTVKVRFDVVLTPAASTIVAVAS